MSKLAIIALLLLATAPNRADEPAPVRVDVGGSFNVCKAELILCPVSSFICDDPKIATVEYGPEGAVVKGVSVGETLCAVLGAHPSFRRVMKVTVTQRPRAASPYPQ